MTITEQLQQTTQYLQQQGISNVQVAVVLGTGLSKLVSKMEVLQTIDYGNIPHFVSSTVEFHAGKLVYGTIGKVTVLVMQGRFHYYEGYTMQQITYPIRVMSMLGAQQLIIMNAAGGLNLHYKKGDVMILTDHINLLPCNPLRGVNEPTLGERFVDMCEPYSVPMREQFLAIATTQNLPVHQGVYVAVMGPNLETKAEYRWLRNMGADAVGMSTVPEVIVANQCKLPCLAISVLTDECNPNNLLPINITEIIAIANKTDEVLSDTVAAYILAQ